MTRHRSPPLTLPSTATEPDPLHMEQLLFIKRHDEENRRRFSHHFARPPRQWVQTSPVVGNSLKAPNRVGWCLPSAEVNCYESYVVGHLSTGFTHPICNVAAVISNYEKLTPDQNARVPDKTYRAALVMIKGTAEDTPSEEIIAAEPRKYYPGGSCTPKCSTNPYSETTRQK